MNATVEATATPELSVVVPTYNVGLWVGELLSSILDDQSTPSEPLDLEVIVVDDGSTDDTAVIVQRVAAEDPRVRLVRSPGSGGGYARDHGVTLARGEYLAFADGDDLVPPGAYNAMLRTLRASGSDMAMGRFFKLYTDKVWWPTASWPAFDEARTGVTVDEQPSVIRNRACWNRVFRLDFWNDRGITFPSVPRSNDIHPMTRAILESRFDIVTETVYIYRDRPGPGSMTAKAVSVEGVASYLHQELRCARMVHEHGSSELRDAYISMFQNADGWVALTRALAGMETINAEALEPAREVVSEIVDLVGRENFDWLPTVRRWGWLLMEAGCWQLADRVAARAKDWRKTPVADLLEILDLLAESGVIPLEQVRKELSTVIFGIAPKDSSLEDGDLADLLVKHRQLVESVWAAGEALPGPKMRRLLGALAMDSSEVLSAVVAAGAESVRVTDASVVSGALNLSLQLHLENARRLEIVFMTDGESRRRALDLTEAVDGRLEVVVPFAELGPGRWRVVLDGHDDVGVVAGPLVIRDHVIGERSTARAELVEIKGGGKHGIEIAAQVRTVERAKRVLRRIASRS